jgi:DNA ligase-1
MCAMPPPNDKPEPTRAKRAPRTLGLKVGVWNGEALQGPWQVSRKLDGVCVIITSTGNAISRAGKPLYNVPTDSLPWGTIYECYMGSWEKSVSAVRSQFSADGKHPASLISRSRFFLLHPLDSRLFVETAVDVPPAWVKRRLAEAIYNGDEGLVLQQGDVRLKVKPKQSYDVPVTGLIMGKGKHAGRMGALITPMGNVGTGFSDTQRKEFAALPFIKCAQAGDVTIEVEAMGLTPAGKFRHPRFVRVRWDK